MSSEIIVHDGFVLPKDIIRLIFDHAAALNSPYRYYTGRRSFWRSLGWITLTHVCRDWRNVGIRMPLLWAAIVTVFPDPTIASELLARAGSCPITIDLPSYFLEEDDVFPEETRQEPFILFIRENLARAGTIRLKDWTVYDRLRGDDDDTLFALREMCIRDINRIAPLHRLHLHAPNLRSAILKDLILPPNSTRTMRELNLEISSEAWESLSAIHDFLRCCLQLRELKLDLTYTVAHDEEYHARDVHLNKLKYATVSAKSEQAVWDIWRPVVVPDDIALNILCQERTRNTNGSAPLLFELCAAQLSHEHYDAVELTTGPEQTTEPRGLRLAVNQLSFNYISNSCILLPSPNYGPAYLFRVFPAFVRKENIRSLTLDSALLQTSQINDIFRTLARALPNVTSLTLQRMTPWPVLLYIRTLGQGMLSPVSFPALQSLRLSDLNLRGVSRNPARSHTQYWWDTVKAALTARSEALKFLVLEGTWVESENWNMEHDGEELRECRSRGLVQELDDRRTFKESRWPSL